MSDVASFLPNSSHITKPFMLSICTSVMIKSGKCFVACSRLSNPSPFQHLKTLHFQSHRKPLPECLLVVNKENLLLIRILNSVEQKVSNG